MRARRGTVAGLAGLAVAAGVMATGVATAQSGGATQELALSVIEGELDYDTDVLRAQPGPIRIVMSNPSVQRHNISLSGEGLEPARLGPVVPQGETSTIEVDLPAGDYTFFCAVGAHAQLGMSGTLMVAEAADPGTPPPPAPGPAPAPPPGGSAGDVTLSVAQLRINQRISQAAVRRLNRLTALLDGRPAPERPAERSGGGDIALTAAQLRINQRISQAAVRRANALEARLEGREPATPERSSGPSGEIQLTAGQLLINQRISQAAVRRANALEPRVQAAVAARAAADGAGDAADSGGIRYPTVATVR